jgi:hypothetical protein
VLVERIGQPFERIARAPAEQRVGELFRSARARRRDAVELAQDPAVVRALPLAVLVADVTLEACPARAAPRLKISPTGKRSSARS